MLSHRPSPWPTFNNSVSLFICLLLVFMLFCVVRLLRPTGWCPPLILGNYCLPYINAISSLSGIAITYMLFILQFPTVLGYSAFPIPCLSVSAWVLLLVLVSVFLPSYPKCTEESMEETSHPCCWAFDS